MTCLKSPKLEPQAKEVIPIISEYDKNQILEIEIPHLAYKARVKQFRETGLDPKMALAAAPEGAVENFLRISHENALQTGGLSDFRPKSAIPGIKMRNRIKSVSSTHNPMLRAHSKQKSVNN